MIDWAQIEGFDWYDGNDRKSVDKHAVSQAEAEQVFFNAPLLVSEDGKHSQDEPRWHALGRTDDDPPPARHLRPARRDTGPRDLRPRPEPHRKDSLWQSRLTPPRAPLPRFASEAEERAYWESHDSAGHVDWSRAERVVLPNLKPTSKAISLRLPGLALGADQGRRPQARRALPVADQGLARREGRRAGLRSRAVGSGRGARIRDHLDQVEGQAVRGDVHVEEVVLPGREEVAHHEDRPVRVGPVELQRVRVVGRPVGRIILWVPQGPSLQEGLRVELDVVDGPKGIEKLMETLPWLWGRAWRRTRRCRSAGPRRRPPRSGSAPQASSRVVRRSTPAGRFSRQSPLRDRIIASSCRSSVPPRSRPGRVPARRS